MNLRSFPSRLSAAYRALLGYPTPAGGAVMPDWPATIIGHPYRLDPIQLDHAKAVRYVSTVHVCVLRRAQDMASLPVVIERETSTGWEPVVRKPDNSMDVWHRANPQQTGLELLLDLHAAHLTHGVAYLVAETFGFSTPRELWVPKSHLVSTVPGPRRTIDFYVFDRGGKQEAIPGKNVVVWNAYQPEDQPTGASPLDAVQLQYETRYDLMRLFQRVVRNGGVGAGYFSVPQPASGVPLVLDEKEKKALGEQIAKMRRKFDMPVILDMLKFENMGMAPKELQFIENTQLSDSDICRVMDTPPWLVGIRDGAGSDASGALAMAEERRYWTNIKSLIEFRDAMLTEKLGPMFGEKGIRWRTDFSAVPALIQPIFNAAQQIVALAGGPVYSGNELRKMTGSPASEDPEMDKIRAPRPAPGEIAQADGPSDKPGETKPAPEPGKKALRLIDTPERAERWRGKDKLMKRYERKFAAAFVGLIRDRKKELLRRLEAGGLRAMHAKRVIDMEELFAPDPDDEAKVHAIYESLIAERGAEAAREVALELEVNLNTQTTRQFIKARETYGLTGSLDTLMQDMRISLAEGVGLNESLSELAARVSKYLGEAEQGRVLTIARTETVSAFNFASVEAWRQTGDVEQVEWLSARDSAVRETHAAADGQLALASGNRVLLFDPGAWKVE